jgi:hypothetical protein
MPRSKNADGSGVVTTGETNSPVANRKGLSSTTEQSLLLQISSAAVMANKLTVPPEFVNPGIGSSRSNTMLPVRSIVVLGTTAMSKERGGKPGGAPAFTPVYAVPPNGVPGRGEVVPAVVTILTELSVLVVASKTKDPEAVPPSSKVTPLKVQVIGSAEAMEGAQRKTNSTGTAIKLRNVILFILLPKHRFCGDQHRASLLPLKCTENKGVSAVFAFSEAVVSTISEKFFNDPLRGV